MTTQILNYVESMHEQREYNFNLIPNKGDWLEIGKFTKIIETFDTKSRWKCIDNVSKDGVITVVLKKMDYERMEKNKEKVAENIIDKHGELMLASVLKCFIKGTYNNRFDIEAFKYKAKTRKHPEKYKKYLENKEEKKYLKRLKENIKKRVATLKKMRKKLREVKNGQI